MQVEAEEGPEEVFAKVEQIFDSLLKEGTHIALNKESYTSAPLVADIEELTY